MTENSSKYGEIAIVGGGRNCGKTFAMQQKLIEELEAYRVIGTVEELQKSVKEENVLKFYYIESEDKYVVGKRIDTLYYAEIGKAGLCFYMSRYLPWGERGYPSEPKEIQFFDWLQGFIKKECGGTIEEFKQAMNFKKYFMELYGEGLEVANWHKNGDLEPLTNFIDEALCCE